MGLGNKLLCLLYPPRCPFCGRVTPDGAPCPSCAEELSRTPPVQAPFPGVEGSYSRLIAAYDYAGMIRQASTFLVAFIPCCSTSCVQLVMEIKSCPFWSPLT